jgi:hypothetical protein
MSILLTVTSHHVVSVCILINHQNGIAIKIQELTHCLHYQYLSGTYFGSKKNGCKILKLNGLKSINNEKYSSAN